MDQPTIWILSVWQPWAWLIVHGDKDVENRGWQTNFRGFFCVHASKKIDEAAVRSLSANGVKLPRTYDLGGIVGVARITNCVTSNRANSRWAMPGGYCFMLKDRKPTKFIPCGGMQRFFRATPDLARSLSKTGVDLDVFRKSAFTGQAATL